MKKLILLVPVLLLMTGCWNYRELNELAITTSLAIDITDEGDYKVSLLIANGKNTQTNNREGQSQTVVYSGVGETISRAFKEISLQIPKIPYIGHLGVVVVSEDVAKEGMRHILDYLLRNPESVKRFYLILAKDDAEEVIKVLSPLETFPGQSISNNIELSERHEAISTSVTYSKFVENLLKKGKDPILPTLTIKGKAEKGSEDKILESADIKTRVKLDTIAIFKDDKLIGYADKTESRGINIITNQIKEMIIQYECDEGGYIVTDLTNMNTTLTPHLKDDKLSVTINVTTNGAIREVTCDKDIRKEDVIKEIEKETKKKVKSKLKKAIEISKEYEADIFGIGNLFYKKYPNYFENIEDWYSVYQDVTFDYNLDIRVSTKGSVQKTI